MIRTLSKIPQYQLFRKFDFPKVLPMNLTVSLTYRCNSRCLTCNIYNRSAEDLSLEEFERVFRSIGKVIHWITFSGGEPFLRKDIFEIVKSVYDNCSPAVINIPTNGILYKVIAEKVKLISGYCSNAEIIVNISIDDIGERHDEIRQVKGGFDSAIRIYNTLKELDRSNLTVGIHTVISKFNVHRLPQIYEFVQSLQPDSFITEIAEERVELDTIGADITPSFEDYSRAVDFLSEEIRANSFRGVSKVAQSFRLEYYNLAKDIMRGKYQVIPCYAGFASAQISPDGDVWTCCVRADPIGNLRENNYDFKVIWLSQKADQIRKSIRKGECYCPLANAAYTNMLHHWNSLLRVGMNYLKWN